jgi:small nuclear ribonucleoprotein G
MSIAQTTASSYPKQGPGPDLRKFMEKRLELKLNAGRLVTGTLRGYDQFMNIVLDQATEIRSPTEKYDIGMVVIRGNSILMWECLDKVK